MNSDMASNPPMPKNALQLVCAGCFAAADRERSPQMDANGCKTFYVAKVHTM